MQSEFCLAADICWRSGTAEALQNLTADLLGRAEFAPSPL